MSEQTVGGRPVTEGEIQAWADEAEVGYDVTELRRRGRPTAGKGPGTPVPVRMDDELLAALVAQAARQHMTRSEAIRAAVRAWVRAA
ncbi:ribbon-helix-helix protein, CopG family [Sanguibacter sp. 25GB23B1]|uniref:ribbon-helix-helix protein, CopG family n=1 Tax=unclassified Sanguibacter TaxID=2645534 RepID=UPI0032AEF0FD